MTPVWKEEKDQEREELETEVRGHNASMTVSIFWSLSMVPYSSYSIFPFFPMWLVQMPKIKPLPKATGVAAELYSSLVATFPPPSPLMKLHEHSQQGCERCRPHLALIANAIQVLPGLRKQRKLTMELVK